ncbi:MAG: hypothetical protein KKD97_16090 [Gammaproteobacteria bacterium]|nr:hypothetical protein [Gammaproteobacteria bacterium]
MNTRNENQAEERQPLQLRWYCLSANGMATLALDENDARNVALESDQLYPRNGPHQAVQMVPVQPDGRGTDAQILKERDIARCAIVGALAAGHAGHPHPGADHWLAAAHDAGVTIASLERADRPVGGWQGDAFQSMEHPFIPHTSDAAEVAMADLDKACCKPLPNAASAALDSMMGRSEWPAFTAARSEPGAEVDSMGIPTSCGKPLCSPDEHHPLCKLHQPAAQATPEPVAWKPIKTSAGGREAVRNFFRSTLKRHDFDDYITGALAADFACVLGGYLQATRPAPGVPDGLPAVLTDWGFDVHDDEEGRTWLTIRNDQDDVARLSVPTFWPASGRQTINAVVLHQFSAALTSALAAAQAKGVQS